MNKTYWNIQGKEIEFYLNWFENLIIKRILIKHNYHISSSLNGQKHIITNNGTKYNKKHKKITNYLCNQLSK